MSTEPPNSHIVATTSACFIVSALAPGREGGLVGRWVGGRQQPAKPVPVCMQRHVEQVSGMPRTSALVHTCQDTQNASPTLEPNALATSLAPMPAVTAGAGSGSSPGVVVVGA